MPQNSDIFAIFSYYLHIFTCFYIHTVPCASMREINA